MAVISKEDVKPNPTGHLQMPIFRNSSANQFVVISNSVYPIPFCAVRTKEE
jgi:hypothetical protein